MTVARISEKEVRERLRLLGLMYQRVDGYATWHKKSRRLLDLIDGYMRGIHAGLEEELLNRVWDRIHRVLGGLVAVIEEHEPKLYRRRGGDMPLSQDILGGHFYGWADEAGWAPPELRERAREVGRLTMARELGTLTSVKQWQTELGQPLQHGPDYGPGILPPNLKAWPETREEFLEYLDGERDAIIAEGHKPTLAELAIRWKRAERPTRDARLKDPRSIDRLEVAADRVGEILERYFVDWREFKRKPYRRRRDALN
jgi:hypothetical protein